MPIETVEAGDSSRAQAMTSRKTTQRIFLFAILLLCVSGTAIYFSFSYFLEGEHWVAHTQEVRDAVGEVETSISAAARARTSFLMSGHAAALDEYHQAASRIPGEIARLRYLTEDNPDQVKRCAELAALTNARLSAWDEAVGKKQQGKPVDLTALLQQSVTQGSRSAEIAEAVRAEEFRLLLQRTSAVQRRFILAILTVVLGFILALLLLYFHYRLLTGELHARIEAEKAAREAYEREAALRHEQDRFRLFVDAVKDYAIYVLDPSGSVASWNQGAERIKGYAAAEVIGKHFSCFFTDEDVRDGKPQEELRIAEQEGRFEGEGWRVRKDGSRFWANIVLTAIKDQNGQLSGFAKVTRDFTERRRDQERLRQMNSDLGAQVAERVVAEEKLANSERSLRQLSRHLLDTQDEERRRIGRELHDSVGQYLAILKMHLDSLASTVGGNHDGAGGQVAECLRLVDEAIKDVRTISYLLYPPMLEELGLSSAIAWYLEGFSKRSSIKTTLEVEPEFGRQTREIELALFRVLQESLANVHRHSGSSIAIIKLFRRNGQVTLQVEDRGRGIPPELLGQADQHWLGSLGVGLRGMNERMRQLSGQIEVSSNENGTTVTASVPDGSALADPALELGCGQAAVNLS